MHPQQKVTVVWVGSVAGWAEHACRKTLFVLSAPFCWLDMQRQQAPKTGSRRNPPQYPAALTADHPTATTAQLTTLASKHNTTPPRYTFWPDNPNPAPVTNTFVPEQNNLFFLLAKNNISQTGGETAGRTLKIQTGGTVRQKAEEEQAERPQSLQEKLWVLAVCDSMKIVDVPEEGSRRFIYSTARRRGQRGQGNEKKIKGEKGW